ncbi:Aldo/keto reductase [Dentipellis sp. KUC8613]|nr:Aldo/keto reductase [Dentipellis sp. KUC8613]
MPGSPKKVGYVRLGNSGLKVSKIILGTMSYGDNKWQEWTVGEEEATKHIKTAYDAGIQTFDTSNVYSNGGSERILGKAIKTLQLPREEIVVITKVFMIVGKGGELLVHKQAQGDQMGYVNQYGLSRKHIFDSMKHSLERLQLDYVDVLLCHRFDYNTPIEETMQALNDVVKAGYARYIGMSSCWAWQFHMMQNYALTHNLTPFICMENHYSLIYREEEREMFPTLKHFGVGSIPWSPLARGLLTRPYDAARTKRGETDLIPRVEEIAKKRGIKMAQVALAWCLAKEHVSAPVVGASSLENLQGLIDAVDVKLTDEEVKYLEEPYTPIKIMGHS